MRALALAAALLLAAASPASAVRECPPDAVPVGATCMDRYEASIWLVPDAAGRGRGVVKKILKGTIRLEELQAVGATQLGDTDPPFDAENLNPYIGPTGSWAPLPGSRPPSPGVYAVSVAGVFPATFVSWHQMEQACALAGKRLPTNQEWQAAAAGTPDPGVADDGATTCATASVVPALTGARAACVSSWGVHDMVGNVAEIVAEWPELAKGCSAWSPSGVGSDSSCFGGPPSSGPGTLFTEPARMLRGGSVVGGGVFEIEAINGLFGASVYGGFRCAR